MQSKAKTPSEYLNSLDEPKRGEITINNYEYPYEIHSKLIK